MKGGEHETWGLRLKGRQEENQPLNQTTRDWYIRVVTLSETKGLSEGFCALLGMTRLAGRIRKCTNIVCFDLTSNRKSPVVTALPMPLQ